MGYLNLDCQLVIRCDLMSASLSQNMHYSHWYAFNLKFTNTGLSGVLSLGRKYLKRLDFFLKRSYIIHLQNVQIFYFGLVINFAFLKEGKNALGYSSFLFCSCGRRKEEEAVTA